MCKTKGRVLLIQWVFPEENLTLVIVCINHPGPDQIQPFRQTHKSQHCDINTTCESCYCIKTVVIINLPVISNSVSAPGKLQVHVRPCLVSHIAAEQSCSTATCGICSDEQQRKCYGEIHSEVLGWERQTNVWNVKCRKVAAKLHHPHNSINSAPRQPLSRAPYLCILRWNYRVRWPRIRSARWKPTLRSCVWAGPERKWSLQSRHQWLQSQGISCFVSIFSHVTDLAAAFRLWLLLKNSSYTILGFFPLWWQELEKALS